MLLFVDEIILQMFAKLNSFAYHLVQVGSAKLQ